MSFFRNPFSRKAPTTTTSSPRPSKSTWRDTLKKRIQGATNKAKKLINPFRSRRPNELRKLISKREKYLNDIAFYRGKKRSVKNVNIIPIHFQR